MFVNKVNKKIEKEKSNSNEQKVNNENYKSLTLN